MIPKHEKKHYAPFINNNILFQSSQRINLNSIQKIN